MTGTVSVELVFDAATDAAVRREWRGLASLGFSSLAAHTAASNSPHITVCTGGPDLRVAELGGQALTVPFAIRLGPPLLFGTGPRRVLARSVVPSQRLLELHAAVHAQLDLTPQLGAWLPHVTLARRLQLSSLPAALDTLEALGSDIEGHVVAVRSWDSTSRTITRLGDGPIWLPVTRTATGSE